ncbi:hypothetical protein CAEBREN_31906 [Caenorhabditis brenneri]|uniref:Uncharacterized protein n=1 Tax=Caenorhabditis brenneri TaxID=135651 RepID=G0P2C0_CAEBE|nr:hypothetical protein CAEBREN_31906 [Caenorhabditis brenneri]
MTRKHTKHEINESILLEDGYCFKQLYSINLDCFPVAPRIGDIFQRTIRDVSCDVSWLTWLLVSFDLFSTKEDNKSVPSTGQNYQGRV